MCSHNIDLVITKTGIYRTSTRSNAAFKRLGQEQVSRQQKFLEMPDELICKGAATVATSC